MVELYLRACAEARFLTQVRYDLAGLAVRFDAALAGVEAGGLGKEPGPGKVRLAI